MSDTRSVRAAVTTVALAAVRERAPAGARIEVAELERLADLDDIDFIVPPSAAGPDLLEAICAHPHLQVVQVLSAGTDWIESHVPPNATLCSARGARDGPVAEWILGALLGATTHLLECATSHTWRDLQLQDLSTATVLVVGMGSIGETLQRYLAPLGTTVVGVAAHARQGVHPIGELDRLLPSADAVVVLTPLTDDTRGLIGAAELSAMRDGALLINAARGPVVDTDALLAELRAPRLRAVLDVTDPEPLPDGHPLWTAPGLLAITPHIAGDSPAGWARAAQVAGEQLARWCRGEPLRNVVRAARH